MMDTDALTDARPEVHSAETEELRRTVTDASAPLRAFDAYVFTGNVTRKMRQFQVPRFERPADAGAHTLRKAEPKLLAGRAVRCRGSLQEVGALVD